MLKPNYDALDRVPESRKEAAKQHLNELALRARRYKTTLDHLPPPPNVEADPEIIELTKRLAARRAEITSDPEFQAAHAAYETANEKKKEAEVALRESLIEWRAEFEGAPSPMPGLSTSVRTKPVVEDEQGLVAWARVNMPICLTVDNAWIKPLYELRGLMPEVELYIGEDRTISATIKDVSSYSE